MSDRVDTLVTRLMALEAVIDSLSSEISSVIKERDAAIRAADERAREANVDKRRREAAEFDLQKARERLREVEAQARPRND